MRSQLPITKPFTRKGLILFCTALITLLIWVSGFYLPAYKVDSPVLFDFGFPANELDWTSELPGQLTFLDDSITVRAMPDSMHKASVNCPKMDKQKPTGKIRAVANLAVIESGAIDGNTSVVGIWFTDDNNKILSYRNIGIMPGRHESAFSEKIIEWPRNATACVFGIIANAGGPTITVTNARVDNVSPNSIYAVAITLIGFLMLAFACYLVGLALRQLSTLQLILPLALFAVLIVGVTITGSPLTTIVHPLFYGALSLLGIGADGVAGNRTAFDWIFKIGHVLIFMLVALFFFAVQQRINAGLRWTLAMLTFIAIASESVQLHVQDRGANSVDVLFDCLGIALAWISVVLFKWCRSRL